MKLSIHLYLRVPIKPPSASLKQTILSKGQGSCYQIVQQDINSSLAFYDMHLKKRSSFFFLPRIRVRAKSHLPLIKRM